MVRVLRALATLALFAIGATMATAAEIAYVRMQRLLDEAPQMISARESIEREFADARRELAQLSTAVSELKQRREREQGLLSATDAEALDRRIAANERKLTRDREALRERLANRQNQLVDQVERSIGETLAELARERQIDIVLSGDDQVLYAHPRLDLTDEVLARLKRAPR